jgi:NHLM bacteriocin system ABC transporter ATP-binding protein
MRNSFTQLEDAMEFGRRDAGKGFPLAPGNRLWLVEEGKLDIFLAPLAGEEPAGALTHILRAEAGSTIFGLPPVNGSALGFFAVPATVTTVLVSPRDKWNSESAASLPQSWRAALTHAAGFTETPELASIDDFHTWVVGEIAARRGEQEAEHAERLQARLQADRRLVSGALRQLSAADEAARGASGSSPLAEVCQAVGRAAGITILAPRSVLAGKAKDPLRAIARHSSVRTRRLVLQGEWWRADSGPMLAWTEEGNRPVALLPRPGGGYEIHDPAAAARARVNRQSAATLSGIAHTFYRPLPSTPVSGPELLRFGFSGSGRDLRTVSLCALLASLLALVTPFATGIIIDTIIPGSDRIQLVQTIALVVAAALTAAMISLTRAYAMLRIEGWLDFSTQAAVWDRLLNLPAPFFRNYSAGDLAHRSLAVSQIRNAVGGNTILSILTGAFSIANAGLMIFYSPAMAIPAMGLALAAFAVTLGAGWMQFRLQRRLAAASGRIAGMVFQFIDGISKFRVSGTESRGFARWAVAFGGQKQISVSARRLTNVVTSFQLSFPVVASIAIFYAAGSHPGASGSVSTGSFLAFQAAFAQLLVAMLSLGTGFIAVLRAIPLYERLRPILETVPETSAGKADPGELSGAVEANHLAFRYSEDAPLVLKDVSFTARPGEFIAFVGASGSGKSTLFRMLLGFEKPLSGAVYFDGQDINTLDIQETRRQLGVVLQNGKLLPGDILTNIAGSSMVTLDEAWTAARMAGLETDIKAMPMGMYTMVAEGGRGLSGGQRQRLMIARAFAAKPKILLFDEATSALDNRSQEIVSKAMEEVRVTRMVIAHRLSTVMKADRIYVLDQGVIAESGTYEELMQQGGLFTELAKRQMA